MNDQLDLFNNGPKSQLLGSSGSYYLEVYYNQASEDFNEAIAAALEYHGINESKLHVVIAIPNSSF